MANTRELRRRIRSVKNTSQITKAMEMVAATKMRRAQSQAMAGRPYNQTLKFALNQLLIRVDLNINELIKPKVDGMTAVLLISTDKSLCGALNTNLFRSVLSFVKNSSHPRLDRGSNNMDSRLHGNDICFYTIGKKARNFVVKIGGDLVSDFENPEAVTFKQAAQIARVLTKKFISGELSEVYLAYPNFVSTLRQEPNITKLLPLDPETLAKELEVGNLSDSPPRPDRGSNNMDYRLRGNDKVDSEDFLFESNINELLEYILNHAIETKVYQALLETKASEHSARMIAMQNATENAKDLVSDLQLSYNQIRQESITRELLEITSALSALE